MEEEGEAALQAARDVRPRPLPRAPLRERSDPRQIVAVRQLLEQEVGERRGRLADGEARVTAAFDQRDAPAALQQRERRQRSAEAGADDGDVGVDAGDGCERHACARCSPAEHAVSGKHALFEVHRVEAIAPRLDAVRAVREALEIPEIDEHPSPRCARASSASARLRSMSSRSGRGTSRPRPAPPSRHCPDASARARRPQRRRRRRRRSSAAATRPARSTGTNGGEISRNTRRATPRSASASRGLSEVVEREPLVQPIERVRMRGLEPHRDLELRRRRDRAAMTIERGEEPIDARARRARDATRRSRATVRSSAAATPS